MKNWKGVLTILLMSVLSLGFGLPAFAAETEALQLKSKSAVLMDAGTGTILYEKNSHEAMPACQRDKGDDIAADLRSGGGRTVWMGGNGAGERACGEYGWLAGFFGAGRNADSRRADEMYCDCICE